MKTKKLSNTVRRGVTGTLAVVLAATAMGPLFSVMSHAASFDYIEQLKTSLNGGCYNVLELVPQEKQSAVGYLAENNETLDMYSKDAGTVAGWKKADRASYMSSVYTDLASKGIIGTTTDFPLTKASDGGYKEYFPWEVTKLDNGTVYYSGDLENGVPKAGAKRLQEMDLATKDQSSIKGRFEPAGEVGAGEYKLNASYSIAERKFFINDFKNKFSVSSTLWQLTNKLVHYESGDNLNFGDKSVTVSTSNGALVHNTSVTLPVHTAYQNKNGYFIEVEKDTEYDVSFNVNVTGGKFYFAIYETSAGSLSELTGATTLYPSKKYEISSSDSYTGNNVFKTTIKTSQLTDITKKVYVQLCFGVDSKGTEATFSDIYFGEPRGFEQDTDRFVYEDAGFDDSEYDYWYDLEFTSISADDWETMDFQGVGIYEQAGEIDGVMRYNCVGVAGVDDPDEIDLDYDKAMAGGYYTAKIKDEVYDGDGNGLQAVSETQDRYHPYRAEPKFEEGTTDLKFKSSSKGYFKALDKTYTYVEEGGDYNFIPDSNAADSITVYTQKAYFANYVTNNNLFRKGALDYTTGDNFSVGVVKMTPEKALANEDSYLGWVKTAHIIVIDGGTGTSVNTSLDKVKFTADISEEMKDAILEAASSTYKVPVVVDARLVNSTYANAISQTTCPNLYSLVKKLIDVTTENGGVSILQGGVSKNVYAFNPANIGSSVSSFATKEMFTAISGSDSQTSPYYDVKYQINYENNIRKSNNPLPNSVVNEGSCLRCIINYKGRRIMGNISNLRVLDIEPYTNDPKESYYLPQSKKTVTNDYYIDEYKIANWLPSGFIKDDEGNSVTITRSNAKDYITLTRMSTAELNGTGAKIIENYDLVYVGASIGNLEKQATYKSETYSIDYNDKSDYFENKLYSGIGDTYLVGNINYDGSNLKDMVSGTVEGNTLAGLLNADYNAITSNIWYISPNYDFGLRTTGNDVTRDVMKQLQEFADAGFPVVFADDLVEFTTSELEVAQLEYNLPVIIDAKTVYRGAEYDDDGQETTFNEYSSASNWFATWGDDKNGEKAGCGNNSQYYVFLRARIDGKVPKGIVPTFKWYWRDIKTGQTGPVNADEPESLDSVTSDDNTAEYWYGTLGDWKYNGTYYDNNNSGFISGMAMPDSGGHNYQKFSKRYPNDDNCTEYYGDCAFYCQVTFSHNEAVTVADEIVKEFVDNQLTLRSNELTFSANKNKCFEITGTRNSSGKETITISPNPAYNGVYIYRVKYRCANEILWTYTYGDCSHGSTNVNRWNINKSSTSSSVAGLVQNTADKLVLEKTCDKKRMGPEIYVNSNSEKDEHSWTCFEKNSSSNKGNNGWTLYTQVVKGETASPFGTLQSGGAYDNTQTFSGNTITIEVENFAYVSDYSVDNTSFLYQFMSNVYNEVDYDESEGKEDRHTYPNVFVLSTLSKTETKEALSEKLNSVQIPNLTIDENVLISYPAALPDRNLEVTFTVYNDKNATGSDYIVQLFIDSNHDAVYSDYEETTITYLRKGSEAVNSDNGTYKVRSSASSGGSYNEYTLQKTLPSSYVGIIPWKIVVTDENNSDFHDSYIGYAYRKAGIGEGTVIKAVQILPADHWSNTVAKRYNAVNQLIADYEDPVIRGIWRPMYDTSHINVSQAPFDSATLAAAEAGNAYKGSIFLGTGAGRDGTIYKDDPNIDGDHENEAWYLREATTGKDISKKSNLIYTYNAADFKNDAFYQLCIEDDSILDRTVYYEDLDAEIDVDAGDDSQYQLDLKEKLQEQFSQFSKDKIKYRTHVEFWVNPKGPKVPKTDSHGNVVTDYFGNTVYAYEQYDFELDIALTDIYEMDFCWYQDMDDVNDEMDFLAQYDMVIMGFGDSYGKDTRQNRAGINLAAATLGFNPYAAMGIRKYVDSGRPVLFCHDTTNGNVNFIDYFALNAVSWIANVADKVEEFWNTTVKETATRIWYWIRNTVRTFIGKEPLDVPSPSVDQELELNNKIADNRTRDGYYNNLVLRYPLKLDRYGITYEIYKSMTPSAWEAGNFRNAHAYTYLLGYTYRDEDGNTKNLVSAESDSHIISEAEMLAHGFTIAYEPGSAKTVKNKNGDVIVQYKEYLGRAEDSSNNYGTEMLNGEEVNSDFKGSQVMADYILDTQGFTKWTIARYISNTIYNDDSLNDDNYYMPITVPGSISTPHRGVYMTSAITQVGSGSITSYPYDVNTSKFGGETGNTDDGKIRIMPTHDQYYQINLNDGDTTVWYCLADPSGTTEANRCYDLLPNDCANSYYIFTSGNVTYTGAGHANIFTEEEAKLFLNTLVGAYRAAKEKPEVHFRDANDTLNIEYQVLTANERKSTTGSTSTFIDKDITGVKIVDPNINSSVNSGLVVNFYSDSDCKSEHSITSIVLYPQNNNGTLGGTPVNHSAGGYAVISDVTYFFETPQEVLDALVDNESYTIYAQSAVGGQASEVARIEYRRLGLTDLT